MKNLIIKTDGTIKVVEQYYLIVHTVDGDVLAYLDYEANWHCLPENKEKVAKILKEMKNK